MVTARLVCCVLSVTYRDGYRFLRLNALFAYMRVEIDELLTSSDKKLFTFTVGTTPVFPEVARAMLPYLGQCWGNPSTTNVFGRRCMDGLSRARCNIR